ncbi:MAG TPA: amidohydrolase family protein [Acidimicrobiia bacterium]|nr:amidohydrolase family protein [Acidimicrobiia bacterium]
MDRPEGGTGGESMSGVRAVRAKRGWDPIAGELPGPLLVLIADGKIVDVDGSGAAPPEGAPVVDCGEATLLPGLIDSHSHLCWEPSADPVEQFASDDDETLLERARRAASRALAAGITTVRDLGDRGYVAVRLREKLSELPHAGPEILAAGPPITRTKGHCWFLGGEADGPEALVEAVDERARRGVDVVKVMATGGYFTPGWGMHESQYTEAALRVVADRAHSQGLPVTAHAHGADGIVAALEAGFDGIEHALFVTADLVCRADPAVIDALADSGIVIGATEAHLPDVPVSPVIARLRDGWRRIYMEMFRRGVRLAVQSDAGIRPGRPHDVLPYGAVSFAGLGMSNTEALRTVTQHAAAACGLTGRKGRLARGYDADLVAFDGHPLFDITALLRPVVVIRAGTPVFVPVGGEHST